MVAKFKTNINNTIVASVHSLYIMMNGECVALIACMRARGIRTGYLSRFRFRLTPMVAKFKTIINDGLVIFFCIIFTS